jgi:AraC-like DNA-binding protein
MNPGKKKWSSLPGMLYYTTMQRTRSKSHFPTSLFATPNPVHQDIFYTVPRAGHLVGGADHHVQREHFPGHELILCLRGRGYVRISGRRHEAGPGQLVWINCHHPHEHGASQEDPWEVYWVRIEGPRLAQMCDILSIASNPVLADFDRAAAEPLFREIFRLMSGNTPEAPALIHATVARLVALVFCARLRETGPSTPDVPPALRAAVERMRLYYFERHRVEQLAALAGMSASHFSRMFKATFGTSPIDWLRRERINQAKRRLVETTDAVKEIAGQVGYADRFFFSKDFKQLTGLSPRDFRRRESESKRE